MAQPQAHAADTASQELYSILDISRESPLVTYERRVLPRLSGELEVLIDQMPARGLNLSFGGMLILSDAPLWPGNRTSLMIALKTGAQRVEIRTGAQVVQLVPVGDRVAMRLRFADIRDADRKAIARWMSTRHDAI